MHCQHRRMNSALESRFIAGQVANLEHDCLLNGAVHFLVRVRLRPELFHHSVEGGRAGGDRYHRAL